MKFYIIILLCLVSVGCGGKKEVDGIVISKQYEPSNYYTNVVQIPMYTYNAALKRTVFSYYMSYTYKCFDDEDWILRILTDEDTMSFWVTQKVYDNYQLGDSIHLEPNEQLKDTDIKTRIK